MTKIEKTLTDIVNEMAVFTLDDGRAAMVHLAAKVWDKALEGDRYCIQMIWERLEGRVPVAAPPVEEREHDDDLQAAIDRVYQAGKADGAGAGTG